MLRNQTIILTGANRGIGHAILLEAVQNHADVFCFVRTVSDAFRQELESLSAGYGVRLEAVHCDLSDEESIKAAFGVVRKSAKRLDILINNAGVNHKGSYLMTGTAEMRSVLQVNYLAPMLLIQLAAKMMMRQRSGNIINIGSVSGLEHNTGNFAYGVTKAALMWATQTLSRELAPYGIRVNAVAPGLVDTEINEGYEKVLEETVLPRMNIKRAGRPEEIASAVLYLATDRSSFVSGQILRVDGGRF